MKKKTWIVLSMGVVICLLALFVLRPYLLRPAPEKLRLGLPMTTKSLLLFVAGDRGIFEKHGLDVSIKEYEAGVLAAQGLLKGEVDIITAAEFVLVSNNLEGADLRAFASVSRTDDYELIARKNRGIRSVADLKGKKIAMVRGTPLEFFLHHFLTLHNIPSSSVSLVNLTPSETVDALTSGAADAMVGFSPYTYRVRQLLGSGAVSWPIQEGQYYYFLMISKPDFLKTRPLAAERFLAALLEAEQFVSEHRGEAQSILMKRLNLTEAYASSIWPQQAYEVRIDQHLLRLMEDEAKWLLRQKGERPDIPNYINYIDWRLLEKIKPDAVGLIH
jgi:ABC-type nitrate/sulfonate/bicarbonate transport system substrate-binding protein